MRLSLEKNVIVEEDALLEEARQRALLISRRLRERADVGAQQIINNFAQPLEFEERLQDLAISPEAWQHIVDAQIDPKMVFAHPDLLRAHPETSLHYRGISTLSLKRVQSMATQVKNWEDGTYSATPNQQRCLRAARIYNAVISVVITGTDGWTLENGYRNVLATIGITEDGSLRNIVGQEGEAAVKGRISGWLDSNEDILAQVNGAVTILGDDCSLRMVYGSEPDIRFERLDESNEWQVVATVEIKSGTDPAGALERLGAIQKSFAETPTRSRNFAVLGVVTPEMRRRLDEMNVARDFSLYQVLHDNESWEDFIREIFHHTLRII